MLLGVGNKPSKRHSNDIRAFEGADALLVCLGGESLVPLMHGELLCCSTENTKHSGHLPAGDMDPMHPQCSSLMALAPRQPGIIIA